MFWEGTKGSSICRLRTINGEEIVLLIALWCSALRRDLCFGGKGKDTAASSLWSGYTEGCRSTNGTSCEITLVSLIQRKRLTFLLHLAYSKHWSGRKVEWHAESPAHLRKSILLTSWTWILSFCECCRIWSAHFSSVPPNVSFFFFLKAFKARRKFGGTKKPKPNHQPQFPESHLTAHLTPPAVRYGPVCMHSSPCTDAYLRCTCCCWLGCCYHS